MTIDEQTLEELTDQCLENKKLSLNQEVPLQPRAYLRVESVVQAALLKSLEKRAKDAQLANLARTAKEKQLVEIGRDYKLERYQEVATELNVRATATGGSSVSPGQELTSDSTGAYYSVKEAASEAGGVIDYIAVASDKGEAANLGDGETLTFAAPVSGVSDPSTVISTAVQGSELEALPDFRQRVLEAQAGAGGGGNTYDYRVQGSATPGVLRVYPFSGKPITFKATASYLSFDSAAQSITSSSRTPFWRDGNLGTVYPGDMIYITGSGSNSGFKTVLSVNDTVVTIDEPVVDEAEGSSITVQNVPLPGDRTVFVESEDESVDRIPTDALLDAVRDDINVDETGTAWPDLGDLDSTLYVEPIERPLFYVEIVNASITESQTAQVRAKIVEDLTTYFNAARMYVQGLDFEMERTDLITDLSVSTVVQGVLDSYGASAEQVIIRVGTAGDEPVTSWQLRQGQIAKLGYVSDNDGEIWS